MLWYSNGTDNNATGHCINFLKQSINQASSQFYIVEVVATYTAVYEINK